MPEKTYITVEEGKQMQLGFGKYQCFEHESSQPKTMPEYTLVKAYGKLSEYDKVVTLELLKFLHQFTFATRDQLMRMLEVKGIDAAGLDENMSRMLEDRQVNSFYLDQIQTVGEAPEDAFVMYCIDFGALALLNHFTNNDCNTWFTSDSVRSSDLIQKYMSTTEFYLALAEAQGPNLKYFKPIYDIAYDHRSIRFSAKFQIEQGSIPHDFLVESIRRFDVPGPWEEKLDKKLTPFATNPKHWHRYFDQEPVYLLLVEDEDDALAVAKAFYNRMEPQENSTKKMPVFRLITDAQVQKGLAKGGFLKYDPAKDPNKLLHVNISMLSGKASTGSSEDPTD